MGGRTNWQRWHTKHTPRPNYLQGKNYRLASGWRRPVPKKGTGTICRGGCCGAWPTWVPFFRVWPPNPHPFSQIPSPFLLDRHTRCFTDSGSVCRQGISGRLLGRFVTIAKTGVFVATTTAGMTGKVQYGKTPGSGRSQTLAASSGRAVAVHHGGVSAFLCRTVVFVQIMCTILCSTPAPHTIHHNFEALS
jgi:hypothetical protein